MKDIPELFEARFMNAVRVRGQEYQTKVRANDEIKIALVGDAVHVWHRMRLSCVVPLANVAWVTPIEALSPPPAAAPKK